MSWKSWPEFSSWSALSVILCCCSGHCVLLVSAPLASLSLAGQEHGRTIPLAVIGAAIDTPASEP